ncbi:MAG: hypothetical protein M5T61_03250 [Acidimicrobiia bacterium]|nr:hypothetical protein [Acidimicrobiia bacterium]
MSKRPSGTLEVECAGLERACDSLATTLKAAGKAERALHRAAVDGDLNKIRRLSAQLAEYAGALEEATRHVATTWTWSEADEERYLEQGYEQELIEAGAEIGVRLDRLDDRLTAFPALLKVLAAQRAVRIDAKRVTALRCGKVLERVVAVQKGRPMLSPERFIELLFSAYSRIVGKAELEKGARLIDVYDLLTIHPEMRKQYDRNEFTRDVHLLDGSGVTTTRAGYQIRFPASTGTKSSAGTLQIVDAKGHVHSYYGIRFLEVDR